MVMVCRPRPNRSTPRKWKASDVARVAKAARRDGATEAELIAAVMGESPQRNEFCEWISDVIAVLVILRSVLAVLASPGIVVAIDEAIAWIARTPIPVQVKAIISGVMIAIRQLAAILSRLGRAIDAIDRIILLLGSACDGIN